MGALRLIIVLVAAAVAALAIALGFRYLTAAKPKPAMAAVRPAPPTARVLVAKRDLKIGERIQATDVAWQPWPANAVNPAFINGGLIDPKANLADKAGAALQVAVAGDPAVQNITGALVREPMLANEPMTLRKVVKGGQGGFMAVKLPTGMRAMSVPVSVETGVGGFILPGDHVDVVQNMKITNSGDQHGTPVQPVQTRTIMTNVTVLAIDQAPESKPGAASLIGATATLQVPADAIDILAKAKDQGSLLLALRSYADMGGAQAVPGVPSEDRRPLRVSANRTEDTLVRVYRGAKASEVKVP